MATSKQTYECYQCKRNGFDNIRVYLDGKTENGKTIYKNEDMTSHIHKDKDKQKQTATAKAPDNNSDLTRQDQYIDVKLNTAIAAITIIDKKLDKLIEVLSRSTSRGGEPQNQ